MSEVQRLKRAAKIACPPETRLVLAFVNRDKDVSNFRHAFASADVKLTEQVEEADIFLMYEHNMQLKPLKTVAELAEFVCNVSNCLKTGLAQAPSDLEAALTNYNKPKMSLPKDGSWNALPEERQKLRHGWVCMLQTIPGISEQLAQWIAHEYTCPRALMDAYDRTPDEDAKGLLLQHMFRAENERYRLPTENQKKLSRRVHQVLTETDPSAKIFGL